MYNLVVNSNDILCIKRWHLGLDPVIRNSKKRVSQARKQMNLRTMLATSLVDAKARSSKRGLIDSLGVSCYIG